MSKVIAGFISEVRKLSFVWNLFWWNYHVERAREHDRRNDIMEPGWRTIIFKENSRGPNVS